jgi:hypothetical protein
LCIVAIPIFAIIFIIRWIKHKKKYPFFVIACVCCVLWIPLIFGAWLIAIQDYEFPEYSKPPKEEESVIEESEIDDSYFNTSGEIENEVVDIDTSMLKVLMDAGYSIEHATQIEEILNTIGIENIEIEKMTGEAEKGLNAVVCYANNSKDRERRFSFTTEDGVLFYAGFKGEDLYDIEQGGYLKNYADVHIPEKTVDMETYITLQELAENEVKNHLNYPSTASFGMFDWGVGRSDDNYKIIGKVTAKNDESATPTTIFTQRSLSEPRLTREATALTSNTYIKHSTIMIPAPPFS